MASESDIDMGDQSVIRVNFRDTHESVLRDVPITIKGATDRCAHRNIELDSDARTVGCRACGAVLDAFDALIAVADHRDHHIKWIRRSMESRRRLHKETEDAKAELKRVKAQLSRARSSLAKAKAAP